MQSETLTETERNTLFVTVHGYEFRLWLRRPTEGQIWSAYWQVDMKEADGTWSYHSSAYGLTEAFNSVRVSTGI
jgi:hypothetical protein